MSNVMFIGWGTPKVGRERQATELFTSTVNYLEGQKKKGYILNYEPIILTAHGGELGGFFLVHGESDKLGQMGRSDEFLKLITQIQYCLDNVGVVPGYAGKELDERMKVYRSVVGGK